MIKITKPEPSDAKGMNEVIKLSWYATYITPEIGITKEDIDLMYAQSEKKQIEVFKHRAENPKEDDISLVAKENDRVVGFIRTKIFPDHIRVRTMYVHPDHMGKGIGTSLWLEMQKFLPRGIPIVAYPAEHTKSVDWYKKMGFVETGEKSIGEEAMASGTRMTGIKMIRER